MANTELRLRLLWAKVLGVDEEQIGLDSSVFDLGGHSIAAMRLVGSARKCGLDLTVTGIFHNPPVTYGVPCTTTTPLAQWGSSHISTRIREKWNQGPNPTILLQYPTPHPAVEMRVRRPTTNATHDPR